MLKWTWSQIERLYSNIELSPAASSWLLTSHLSFSGGLGVTGGGGRRGRGVESPGDYSMQQHNVHRNRRNRRRRGRRGKCISQSLSSSPSLGFHHQETLLTISQFPHQKLFCRWKLPLSKALSYLRSWIQSIGASWTFTSHENISSFSPRLHHK